MRFFAAALFSPPALFLFLPPSRKQLKPPAFFVPVNLRSISEIFNLREWVLFPLLAGGSAAPPGVATCFFLSFKKPPDSSILSSTIFFLQPTVKIPPPSRSLLPSGDRPLPTRHFPNKLSLSPALPFFFLDAGETLLFIFFNLIA